MSPRLLTFILSFPARFASPRRKCCSVRGLWPDLHRHRRQVPKPFPRKDLRAPKRTNRSERYRRSDLRLRRRRVPALRGAVERGDPPVPRRSPRLEVREATVPTARPSPRRGETAPRQAQTRPIPPRRRRRAVPGQPGSRRRARRLGTTPAAVSYTHLTLPTIL